MWSRKGSGKTFEFRDGQCREDDVRAGNGKTNQHEESHPACPRAIASQFGLSEYDHRKDRPKTNLNDPELPGVRSKQDRLNCFHILRNTRVDGLREVTPYKVG